jgi:type II secretory ATPase GspE/PulE/Tfp pilus assembly ATPase PilB-like protein
MLATKSESGEQGRHQVLQRDATIFAPLIERKLIDPRSLDAAVAEAYDRGCGTAALLMERHRITKRAIGDALSGFYKCAFVEFDEKFSISRELVSAMNIQYLRANVWVPLWRDGTTLHVAIDDPHSSQKIQDIQQLFAGHTLRLYVGLRSDILRFIDSLLCPNAPADAPQSIGSILQKMETEPAAADVALECLPEGDVDVSDSVVVRIVNRIIYDAHKAGASDIHIEPYPRKETIVRFRVDGECHIYQKIPPRYRRALAARVKIMAGLDIAERRKPQDGKITLRLPDARQEIELRVATIPTVADNEDVVMRVLASREPVPLDQLDLSAANFLGLKTLLENPHGVLLCVGPTGSGKTTTLHSALSYLNGPDMKIWTAEDPVEITQYGLRQVQVQPKIGLTFASILRSFLRADPDVVMIGEMRDHETAEIAVQAALTGHLVLSTLHTNSAAETVTRLLDMGLDPFNYGDALLGVLAQRLVRRICVACRKPYNPSREEFEQLSLAYGEPLAKIGFDYGQELTLYRAAGCAACGGSGYKGRLGIHELLIIDDDVRRLIRTRAPSSDILAYARPKGMKTLVQDGIVKCLKGLTDLRQVTAAAKGS